jgi:SAM-dependent methyltransferase
MSSDAIEAFYTSHPYPPPVTNLDRARDEWQDVNRHRAEYYLLWANRPYRADLDILVAGCGTWQAAKYAICRPTSRIVGIDVSATSIACTDELRRQYGLQNLEIRQLPLEDAGRLDRRFDLIVCTGVLHHLVDPDAGLQALRSVLTHDGAMHLMVYASYGRIGAHLLQQYCRTLGIGTSESEIHDLVVTLQALPQTHPLVTLFRGSRDARNADALADALLNPRDRSYSVTQLLDLLDRNGLSFGRWYRQAPYLPACGAIASTPHADRLSALTQREQYAAMELWRGTMTSHSAIVHPSDAAHATIQFDDDEWRRYVPVRLPWTQLVRERLPPGSAGVLLNRSHQDHDLIIPLDADDLRLFERIDGRRTIDEIAAAANGHECRRARTFFETLWSYDQVVFDASHAS